MIKISKEEQIYQQGWRDGHRAGVDQGNNNRPYQAPQEIETPSIPDGVTYGDSGQGGK